MIEEYTRSSDELVFVEMQSCNLLRNECYTYQYIYMHHCSNMNACERERFVYPKNLKSRTKVAVMETFCHKWLPYIVCLLFRLCIQYLRTYCTWRSVQSTTCCMEREFCCTSFLLAYFIFNCNSV